MVYSAIDWLDQVVSRSARVLEIGSGGSTIWWANRGCSVTAVESDEAWFLEISETLKDRGLADRVQIHFKPDLVPETLTDLAGSNFDVVVVDGPEPRMRYLAQGVELLSGDGMLVLDNSDTGGLDVEEGLSRLDNFWRLDFFGLGPINLYAWQTSIFGRQPILPVSRPLGLRDSSSR